MLNDLWEFLFCPIHGILSPANWPVLSVAFATSLCYTKGWWQWLLRRMKGGR